MSTQPDAGRSPAQADATASRASTPPTQADADDGASPPVAPAPKHTRRLTDPEKEQIISAHKQGWGYQRIADSIGRSKSTVQAFIKRYMERGTRENGKHTGRPKKISEHAEKVILDLIEGDCSIAKVTLMQIPELNHIHPRTLDRMLRGKGIRKWRARKRPKLLPRHASA